MHPEGGLAYEAGAKPRPASVGEPWRDLGLESLVDIERHEVVLSYTPITCIKGESRRKNNLVAPM